MLTRLIGMFLLVIIPIKVSEKHSLFTSVSMTLLLIMIESWILLK